MDKQFYKDFIKYFMVRERKLKCSAKDENDLFYDLYRRAKENLKQHHLIKKINYICKVKNRIMRNSKIKTVFKIEVERLPGTPIYEPVTNLSTVFFYWRVKI